MNISSTKPKPFVFVLMPFHSSFDDIYKFGIKGAAQDANAYAERVDEQIFTEGILDRVFSQINKADVIVADMTGRSANVFYEVGYAHALGKTVLLLTKNVEDIPFDLKHRQHIVYKGSIEALREQLSEKLRWAIRNAKNVETLDFEDYTDDPLPILIDGEKIYPTSIGLSGPRVKKRAGIGKANGFVVLKIEIRNWTQYAYPKVDKSYISCSPDSFLVPNESLIRNKCIDDRALDELIEKYELNWEIPALPVKSSHSLRLILDITELEIPHTFSDDLFFRIQFHIRDMVFNYPFVLDYWQDGVLL